MISPIPVRSPVTGAFEFVEGTLQSAARSLGVAGVEERSGVRYGVDARAGQVLLTGR